MLLIHPFEKESRVFSQWLLQISIVALGFGWMRVRFSKPAARVLVYGDQYRLCADNRMGYWQGPPCQIESLFPDYRRHTICGGSAIATIAGVTNSDDDEFAMCLGTVVTSRSIALLIFPAIGLAMHLTQTQFSLWSARAVHDTRSVVGATICPSPLNFVNSGGPLMSQVFAAAAMQKNRMNHGKWMRAVLFAMAVSG